MERAAPTVPLWESTGTEHELACWTRAGAIAGIPFPAKIQRPVARHSLLGRSDLRSAPPSPPHCTCAQPSRTESHGTASYRQDLQSLPVAREGSISQGLHRKKGCDTELPL